MDLSLDPCDDFSAYVCGNFDKTHKIPPGRSSISVFEDVSDDIILTLKDLLESQPLHNKNLPQTKAAIYYKSCLNMTARNKMSKKPIMDLVKEIYKKKSYEDKVRKLISSGMATRFLSFSVDQDSKNPEYYILNIGKPQLILSEGTLQNTEDEENKKQIEVYKEFMNNVLDLLGLWKKDRSIVDEIVKLNIKISKFLPSLPDQLDPEKSYNKVKISELETRCPHIKWIKMINQLLVGTDSKLSSKDEAVLFSKGYIGDICQLFQAGKKEKEIMALDVVWAAIDSLVKYGSQDFVTVYEDYLSKSTGTVGKEELWKKCVRATSDTMVDIVGNMYVKENFHSDSKNDAEEILINTKIALKKVIEDINWMDNKTKEMAILKLKSMKEKIGSSEKLLNETDLKKENERINMHIGSYMDNHLQYTALTFVKSMMGVGQKSPEDRWFMGPQEVNAYYNPPGNEIVFPASIFRFPFYDIDFPASVNYGGIGNFFSHEILHGFDTSGSKYDDTGRMRDWWTSETRSKYDKKSQCIIDQFGNYTIYGKNLPSSQTIGEDLADLAGVRMALMGLKMSTHKRTSLPGLNFTENQLYFINYGVQYCSIYTKERILEKLKSDEHTIWKFRIDGPLSNMPEFYEAFKCTSGKKMYREKQCLVW